MKNKFKILTLLFIVLFLMDSNNVYAEQVQNNVCVSNNIYTITWDSVKNPMVKKELIDEIAIKNGHVAYPSNVELPELEKEKYKFSYASLGTRCEVNSQNEIIKCPGDSGVAIDISKVVDIVELEETYVAGIDKNGNEIRKNKTAFQNITMNYDETSGKILVRLKNIFGSNKNKIKIRNVTGKSESQKNNDDSKKASDYSASDFLTLDSDGYYTIGYYSPSSSTYDEETKTVNTNEVTIALEFYLNDKPSKCKNMYIGNVSFITTYDSDIEINNPAISNKTFYGCDKLYKADKPNELLDFFSTEIVRNAVPECFNSTIKLYEKAKLKENITNKVSTLIELYKDYPTTDDSSSPIDETPPSSTIGSTDFVCKYDANGNIITQSYTSKNSMSASENGWTLSCYETYKITPTNPKIVEAGQGFSYETVVITERICKLSYDGHQVRLKPQCRKVCHHECYLPDGTNPWGDPNVAGPNEVFDSCVYKCDNGKYTQGCINSCYNKVYGNNRDLSFIDESQKSLINDINSGSIIRTGAVKKRTGNADCGGDQMCEDGCGNSYRYSNWCNGKGTICTEYEEIVPSGCSWNPQAEYNSEISAIRGSKSRLEEMAKSYANINNGEYTIHVMDSYLKKNDNTTYTYTFKSENWDGPKLIVNATETGSDGDPRTVQIGELRRSDDFVSYTTSTTRSKTITVKLPDSYLSRVNSDSYYRGNESKLYTSNLNNGKYKNPVTLSKVFYKKGDNYFYSNINSSNYNVTKNADEKITFIGNPQVNIGVTIKNAGTNGKLNKKYGCYYGVYNGTICSPPSGCSNPNSSTCQNLCPGDGEGIQIIFRPIDLDDNFPNDRSARWNWKNDASVTDNTSALYKLLNYKIMPETLNKNIENKGYKIYEDPAEVDYDFTLTSQQLTKIKNEYNKEKITDINKDGEKNYLDYDMSCISRNNRDYCYSNFLDNLNYVTFNSSNRKEIAICNNTYNGACAELGGTE